MFNRLPKPRYRFDPFGDDGSEVNGEKRIRFKRKRISEKNPGRSPISIFLMLLAVTWFIYYFGGFR